jgi:Zn-dependent peptidase ImmA (M78 family)
VVITAPYLPYETLRQKSAEFLDRFHPSGTIPVPVEWIADFRFQMDIVGIPGLQEVCEVDSCLSKDLTTIYIDDYVLRKRPARYRFSIAHELSHKLIHADIFRQIGFDSIEAFKATIDSIDPREYGWLEYQAYGLAGLILVPPSHLNTAYEACDTKAAEAGISLRDADMQAAQIVCANIARDFEVSHAVVRKRLRLDNLIDWETRMRS